MDDLLKIADIFGKAQSALSQVTTEGGEVTVLGRLMRYQLEGYMYKWELNFKAEILDVGSGFTGEAKENVSRFTSLRKALNDLLVQLHGQGYLGDISPTYLRPLSKAISDSIEDPSKRAHAQKLQEEILSGIGPPREQCASSASTYTASPQSGSLPPNPSSPKKMLPITSQDTTCTGNTTSLGGQTASRYNQPTLQQEHSEGYVLTERDLPQLQKLLVDEAYQSFTMGIHLGLSVGMIRALQKDAPSDIFQFQGLILAKWLQCTSPRPTVQKLVDVISGPVINNKGLACDIKEHYGLP